MGGGGESVLNNVGHTSNIQGSFFIGRFYHLFECEI